jgi:hypothetical protein
MLIGYARVSTCTEPDGDLDIFVEASLAQKIKGGTGDVIEDVGLDQELASGLVHEAAWTDLAQRKLLRRVIVLVQ